MAARDNLTNNGPDGLVPSMTTLVEYSRGHSYSTLFLVITGPLLYSLRHLRPEVSAFMSHQSLNDCCQSCQCPPLKAYEI